MVKKPGQASLEYMMGYGWVVLIIIILGAFIYYSGVLTPSTAASAVGFEMLKPASVSVESQSTYLAKIKMGVKNYANEPLTITSTTISSTNSKNCNYSLSSVTDYRGRAVATSHPFSLTGGKDYVLTYYANGTNCGQPSGTRYDYKVVFSAVDSIMNSQIDSGSIRGLYRSCPNPLPTGLVGYWQFREGSGTTTADDSGNGNAGALINGPTWTVGKNGYGLQFNGVNQFVNVSYSPALQPSSITMVAWAKASSVPSAMSGIISNKLASYDGINLRMGNSSINVSSSVGNGTPSNNGYLLVNTNQTTQVNVWFHLAVTHDASDDSNKIYVNGDLKNQQQFKLAHAANVAAIIGNTATSSSLFFNGTIDEVTIWNRALSGSEIQQLYACSAS